VRRRQIEGWAPPVEHQQKEEWGGGGSGGSTDYFFKKSPSFGQLSVRILFLAEPLGLWLEPDDILYVQYCLF
jgi:hypothetical protein